MIFAPFSVNADQLSVVTDISPVQSLVQMVAGDLAKVDVIVRPGATPHSYALRPSEARALQNAELVVWIGPELAPWLVDAIETIAVNAENLSLIDVENTLVLPTRMGAQFGEHDHDDHDDHDDHAEADHDNVDPHVWLAPENAQIWVSAIAESLARVAPESAPVFRANAVEATASIAAAAGSARDNLSGYGDQPFVAYHDAFQYFEQSFGLSAAGALALSDATPPSASRLAEIRDVVARAGIVCAIAEPQFDSGLVDTVFGRNGGVSVAVLDPLAADITAGPNLYIDMIQDLASRLVDCLS
jgi:zinc transport system substrate-binding protein